MAAQNSMNPIDVSRLGQINATGDASAMFLKVFSGEVLQVFEEANVMMPLHTVRTISSGKTAQFPVMGTASAKYHTPGESILGSGLDSSGSDGVLDEAKYLSKVKHAERTISIDGTLVSSAFIADIDEAKNHYDVRSGYTTAIGRELAYHSDRALIRTVIAGARATTDRFNVAAGTSTQFLGAAINEAGAGAVYTAAEMVTAIASIAQKMDEKNVPAEGRYVLLTPAEYYKLVSSGNDAINTDFGGMGSIATGEVAQVAGIRILKSNHIPNSNEAGTLFDDAAIANNPFDATGSAGYSANFSNTAGVIFQTEGVGTVKLLDLALESEYQLDRLGTLMVAKYAMGHGVLREECCYEIVSA